MTYKLSFRVRRCYFDAIVRGEKKVEVRRRCPFWDKRVNRAGAFMIAYPPVVAVFVCGKDVHRREIKRIQEFATPFAALGRHPSEQEKQFLGAGLVWAFHLGEEIPYPK